jgi:flagellar hook-associated protein 2
LTQDTDTVFNSIKSFVDKYNTMIDTINAKSDEKYDRDYPPLTTDQRAAMSDTDITKWETQAKTGLLHNDGILNKIVEDMRKALYDPINGIANGLTSIGITTGSYEDKGKLVIDETALRSAISTSPDKVTSIFSKESTKIYSPNASAADRATRYSDNGIANRLSDIIQDNIRTTRDSNGTKGVLLEQAGLVGDISEFTNSIYKEIGEYDTKMDDLNSLMTDKENRYYAKFSAMEEAISKMKSQSSWLGSQGGTTAG